MQERAPIELSDLRIGTVVYFHDPLCDPPKPKFCIIVGMSDDQFDIATVYINSEMNVPDINSHELVSLHYLIEREKYSQFLKKDSYIDCSKVKPRMQSSFLM